MRNVEERYFSLFCSDIDDISVFSTFLFEMFILGILFLVW